MTVHTGRHRLGTDRDRIVLHTFGDGMTAQAGHDLWAPVGAMGKPGLLTPEAVS